MKIGIVVHSHTGNTLSVAQKLREKLLEEGHSVNLERVTAADENNSEASSVHLTGKPDVSKYDALIFGAPVRGFSLSPAMTAYLSQLASLSGKDTACFLTQFFPSPAMGGNRAIGQMKELCSSKGAEVYKTGIINWANPNRDKKIDEVVEKLSRIWS